MKKRFMMLAAILALTVSFAGCSNGTGTETTAASEETGTAETETGAAETEAETEAEVVKEEYDALQYVDLGEYKGIEVSKAAIDVSDEVLQSSVDTQLSMHAYTQEVTDRPVQEGDSLNIDYKGTMDGEAFDGGSAEGATLVIGSGQFIDGFEDGLIGVAAGETVNLPLSFPDPYEPNPDFSGKAVNFEVTVNTITETITPELTDEFAQEISDYATAEEFREGLRSTLREQNKKNAAMEALMAQAQFETMPENLIAYYENEVIQQLNYQSAMYGMTYDMMLEMYGMTEEEFMEAAAPDIENNAKQDVLLEAIVAAEGMELTEEEYQAGAEELAQGYGMTAEDVIAALGEDLLKENLLWNKAIDFVAENAVEVE